MQFKYILLILLSVTLLNATIYEDGNNGTDAWSIYDNTPEGATISNVYDEEKDSDVIKLEGDGTQNGYMIGSWCDPDAWHDTNKIISWSMKFAEDYNIFISMQTKKGHRYVYYTNAKDNEGIQEGKYIHHGFGKKSADGHWHRYTRNLETDLKDYEPDNSIISIDAFLVRGSGLIDDIELAPEETNISTAYYTVEEVSTGGHPKKETTNIYRHDIDHTDKLATIFHNYHITHVEDGSNLISYTSMSINNITYFLVRYKTFYYGWGTQEHIVLWKTDGTISGTSKIKIFDATSASSEYMSYQIEGHFINYTNNKLYFLIKSTSTKPDGSVQKTIYDFWQSDGSKANTLRIKRVVKEK